MKITKFILCMGALLTLNLAPIHAIAGNAGIENGEMVICRGQESHTSGPMVQIGVDAPDFQATNAEMKEVSLSSFKGKRVILNIFPTLIRLRVPCRSASLMPGLRNWKTQLCYVFRWTCLLHSRASVPSRGWKM